MKVHAGVVKDSGLIHSVVVTTANVHDLTPEVELLNGDERVVYVNAGYQGIAKRAEMARKTTEFRVAMRIGKRRALLDTPEGRLQDLIKDFVANKADRLPRRMRSMRRTGAAHFPASALPGGG
jgi:IS5 family transposase